MKRFAAKVIFFCSIYAAFHLCTWFGLLPVLRKSRAPDFAEWNDIYNGNTPADLLIMGNSVARYQVDPRILDSVLHLNSYNLGINGASFTFQLAKYQVYRRYHAFPKTIIQCVSDHTFFIGGNLVNPLPFIPYADDRQIRDELRKTDYPWYLLGFPWLAAFLYPQLIKQSIRELHGVPENVSPGIKGFYPISRKTAYDTLVALAGNQRIAYTDSTSMSLFKTFVRSHIREGGDFFIVFPPQWRYREHISPDHRELAGFFRQTALETGCLFLDYSEDPRFSDYRLYADPQHMNSGGAERFTKCLSSELLRHNAP